MLTRIVLIVALAACSDNASHPQKTYVVQPTVVHTDPVPPPPPPRRGHPPHEHPHGPHPHPASDHHHHPHPHPHLAGVDGHHHPY